MAALATMKVAFDATTANKNCDFVTNVPAFQILTTGDQTKSLTPDGVDSTGLMRWAYKGGGIALGYPTVTLLMRRPTKTSRVNRYTVKVVLPVLEQTSASTASGIQPAPTLAYNLTGNLEFLIPERASTIEKNAFLSLVLSLLVKTIRDNANANPVSTASPLFDAILSDDHPF